LDTDYISAAARADATKIFSGRLTEDMIISRDHTAGDEEISLVALGLFHLDHRITNARFQGIKRINLENNNLSDVSALAGLPKLTRLELRQNRINAAFGRASYFCKLKYLDLSGNYISSLSVLALGTCPNLQTLILCENFLTRLDGINQLKSLRVLKADKNKLSRIDANTFDDCKSLRVLSMRKNAFRTLKHLTKLVYVRELHLDENRVDDLEEISWLACLTRLRILSLARNKISTSCDRYFDFVTKCCGSLKQLDGEKLVHK
jgi:internalin A